jgi:hypothetical protein
MGLDTKTYWLTDRQSQCDFDFDFGKSRHSTRVEAGSNTSTVTLRVVGGDEKGRLESEREKYGREPTGLVTENDCAGEGQQQL